MTVCFIFVKHPSDEAYLSLCLNEQGELLAPLLVRDREAVKDLQANARTIVVVSSTEWSLFHLELPWLSDKKGRAAIPYALEDKLATNVDELHFAFDRHHYHQGQYLVAVGSKTYLREIISQLDRDNLPFDALTLDWFALENKEICVLESRLLIHDKPLFCGSLSRELAPLYLSKAVDLHGYAFTNSDTLLKPATFEETRLDSSVWIAKRLQKQQPLNLCQGEFQHGNANRNTRRWYMATAVMCLLWIFCLLLDISLKRHAIDNRINEVDTAIATLYRQFFPEAKQVISPRFRIGQLLKSQKKDNDGVFWSLMNQLTQAIDTTHATVEQLHFQNQTLQVNISVSNFDTLEALQTLLQEASVRVKQSQASSKDERVIATLELSL